MATKCTKKERIGHGTMKEVPHRATSFPSWSKFHKALFIFILKALFKGNTNPVIDRHLGLELARLCAELARFCATTYKALR